MKRLLALLAIATGLSLTTLSSHAQVVVSVQYQTNGSPTIGGDTAGVVSVSGWNTAVLPYVNGGTDFTLNDLKDSNGNTISGLNETTHSSAGYDENTGGSFTGTGDQSLYRAFALGNFNGVVPLTVTLTGLMADHQYTLITYFMGHSGATNSASVTGILGSSTFYYLGANNSLSTYTQATATTSGTATAANYAQFDNLTGSTSLTFSLDTSASAGNYNGLNGFQLIDNGSVAAVPEPSTVLLTLVGLLALTLHLRRRRTA